MSAPALTVVVMLLFGGLGAALRFFVDGELSHRFRPRAPWPTIVINVIGSFVLGALAAAAVRHGLSADLRLIGGTGLCGGFTTFSTAMVEQVRLVQAGRVRTAVVCTGTHVFGSLLAVSAGYALLALG